MNLIDNVEGTLKNKEKKIAGTNFLSPDIEICLFPSMDCIIAKEPDRNKITFYLQRNDEIILTSSPQTLKEGGLIGWFNNVNFFVESEKIAEIRYRFFKKEPILIVDDEILSIKLEKCNNGIKYWNQNFEIFINENALEAHFNICEKQLFYPVICYSYYVFSINTDVF